MTDNEFLTNVCKGCSKFTNENKDHHLCNRNCKIMNVLMFKNRQRQEELDALKYITLLNSVEMMNILKEHIESLSAEEKRELSSAVFGVWKQLSIYFGEYWYVDVEEKFYVIEYIKDGRTQFFQSLIKEDFISSLADITRVKGYKIKDVYIGNVVLGKIWDTKIPEWIKKEDWA